MRRLTGLSRGYRPRQDRQTMGYAWLGPLQVEWGDGVTLRLGERRSISIRVRIA